MLGKQERNQTEFCRIIEGKIVNRRSVHAVMEFYKDFVIEYKGAPRGIFVTALT